MQTKQGFQEPFPALKISAPCENHPDVKLMNDNWE